MLEVVDTHRPMPMTALLEAWNGSEVVDTHRLCGGWEVVDTHRPMPMTALVEAWNGSEVVDTHRMMPMAQKLWTPID